MSCGRQDRAAVCIAASVLPSSSIVVRSPSCRCSAVVCRQTGRSYARAHTTVAAGNGAIRGLTEARRSHVAWAMCLTRESRRFRYLVHRVGDVGQEDGQVGDILLAARHHNHAIRRRLVPLRCIVLADHLRQQRPRRVFSSIPQSPSSRGRTKYAAGSQPTFTVARGSAL